MRVVRQAASGLLYGMVALLLVIGSLALAQAQASGPSFAASTYTPLPSSTPTARPSPLATNTMPASATVSGPGNAASATNSAQPPTRTATKAALATLIVTKASLCGAPHGWVRAYVVQPGDTLFRIARIYGVSVEALQNANCRSSTVIYVGERLWVPFAGPAATELTIIPTFPTPTEPAEAVESVEPAATDVTPNP